MKRHSNRSDDPSDIRRTILPLFSVFYVAIILLNLMRVAFTVGGVGFLWMWVPSLTPLHTSVISLIVLIAGLGAILLFVIAYGEVFPSGFTGKILRASFPFFAVIIVTFVLILDSFGKAAFLKIETVYEEYKDDERIRFEEEEEIKELLNAFSRRLE